MRSGQVLSGKESACSSEDMGSTPGLVRSPGEKMATHSSILAWEMPWTEEPGGYSLWSRKIGGHDLATKKTTMTKEET